MSLLHPKSKGVFRLRGRLLSLAAKDTPRTGLSISGEMVPSTKPWMALPSGCIAGSLAGAPPIHFGREDGVERTLLRVACQSETFLVPPWQGDASIRYVGHIGCQSDFDELVSMACRPVDRGFCRMGETKVPFHPVKWRFARTAELKNVVHPVKGGFGRTKLLIAEVQAQASRTIELGAALEL